MPLDETRLMLEQWGNITGEPRGVDYTEVLGSWTPASTASFVNMSRVERLTDQCL
jgi:hypothetical protein